MTHCTARTPRTGSHTTSWAGDHHCRLPHDHDGPHHCTCSHEWDTPTHDTTNTPNTPHPRVTPHQHPLHAEH